MKNLILILILTFLFSCNSNVNQGSENVSMEYESMCDCLDSIDSNIDIKELEKKTMDCIIPVSGKDKDEYFKALKYGFYNCPRFVELRNEIELSEYQIDTIEFKPLSSKECNDLPNGKWKDMLALPGDYSIRKGSINEIYKDNKLISVWKVINQENCTTTFVIKEDYEERFLPPFKGDTVIIQSKGVFKNMVLSNFIMGGIQLTTVGIKITDSIK